jgi:hypothetical protein
MNKMTGLAVGVALALTGCLHGRADPKDVHLCGPAPTQAQAEAAVSAYVSSAGLKDPSSAQVQNITVVEPASWFKGLNNGGGYVHGWLITFELNAKNSYGGYVGFRGRELLRLPDGRAFFTPPID